MAYGCRVWGVVVLSVAVATVAGAQTPLPMNTMTAGTVGDGDQTDYSFVAKQPGLLSVALAGAGDDDLFLEVRDEEGQRLTDGYADGDLQGKRGLERLSVIVPEPGTYMVTVGGRGSGSRYDVGATFLEASALAPTPDPDGRPSKAQTLTIGQAISDEVGPGDPWDWFVVKAPKAGTLVITTTGEDGDLALEAHLDEASDMPDQRSDDDRDGKGVNEQVSLEAQAGQAVYVRVVPLFTSSTTAYRIQASLK
jgi:hypothetical protein